MMPLLTLDSSYSILNFIRSPYLTIVIFILGSILFLINKKKIFIYIPLIFVLVAFLVLYIAVILTTKTYPPYDPSF